VLATNISKTTPENASGVVMDIALGGWPWVVISRS
jgi:hypothetical protein